MRSDRSSALSRASPLRDHPPWAGPSAFPPSWSPTWSLLLFSPLLPLPPPLSPFRTGCRRRPVAVGLVVRARTNSASVLRLPVSSACWSSSTSSPSNRVWQGRWPLRTGDSPDHGCGFPAGRPDGAHSGVSQTSGHRAAHECLTGLQGFFTLCPTETDRRSPAGRTCPGDPAWMRVDIVRPPPLGSSVAVRRPCPCSARVLVRRALSPASSTRPSTT